MALVTLNEEHNDDEQHTEGEPVYPATAGGENSHGAQHRNSSWNETMALIYQTNQRQNSGRSFLPDLEVRPRVGTFEISLEKKEEEYQTILTGPVQSDRQRFRMYIYILHYNLPFTSA